MSIKIIGAEKVEVKRPQGIKSCKIITVGGGSTSNRTKVLLTDTPNTFANVKDGKAYPKYRFVIPTINTTGYVGIEVGSRFDTIIQSGNYSNVDITDMMLTTKYLASSGWMAPLNIYLNNYGTSSFNVYVYELED